MSKVSINLAACALASDVREFGVAKVISGPIDEPYDSTSLGANLRRFHDGVTLKTPPASGISELPVRGWLFVYVGDGSAMGQLCGTNTSFSAAHNICNCCEDALQQDVATMRVPNGFLECTCTDGRLDANVKLKHVAGCPCKFRLRTPARDAARRARPHDPREQQRLGLRTEEHAFVRVPCFLVSRPGPKDAMHTFLEGCTRHLAAYTLIMMVAAGWATEQDLRVAIASHKYATRDGLSRPGFLPSKLFVMTKVKVPAQGGRPAATVWAPHKEAKLPYSAYQNLIYTIHSLEMLRKFVPVASAAEPLPAWWMAWVLHVAIVSHTLRFSFTYADLQVLEEVSLKWQEVYYSVPEYHDTWRPKVHWMSHLAHDIFLWGPPRLLWAMIMEMKNREFKLACMRSNYFNPVKSVAEFWVDQSSYQLRKRKRFSVCVSTDAKLVGLSGVAEHMLHAPEVSMLVGCVPAMRSATVEYISEVNVRGVCFEHDKYCLLGEQLQVCKVVHILRVQGDHYAYLRETGVLATPDEFGVLHCSLPALEACGVCHRLVSMTHANMSAVWHYTDRLAGVVRLYVKW